MAGDVLVRLRQGGHRGLVRAGVHADARPQLAVHLHADFHGVGRDLGFVEGRPTRRLEQTLRVAEALVQLFGDVRRERREHHHQRREFGAFGGAPAGARHVEVFHHRRDGGVELQRRHLLAHLFDGAVQGAFHMRFGRAVLGGQDALPQAVQKAGRALDAAALVVRRLIVRADEQQIEAHRVRSVFGDDRVRGDHVAAALGHLASVADDEAVGAELAERLVEVERAEVVQRHGEKARVHEVQHGVFVAADVAVHGKPLARELRVEGRIVPVRARIA